MSNPVCGDVIAAKHRRRTPGRARRGRRGPPGCRLVSVGLGIKQKGGVHFYLSCTCTTCTWPHTFAQPDRLGKWAPGTGSAVARGERRTRASLLESLSLSLSLCVCVCLHKAWRPRWRRTVRQPPTCSSTLPPSVRHSASISARRDAPAPQLTISPRARRPARSGYLHSLQIPRCCTTFPMFLHRHEYHRRASYRRMPTSSS